jgi:hypothetical protein
LLDGRSEVNDEDYRLVCRVALDSLPPARIAVLKALLDSRSPFSLGLPKATIERAIEDLELSGVLTQIGELSEVALELLAGADMQQATLEQPGPSEARVPESTPRYRNETGPTMPPISGTRL